jgi:hypothetical protein
MLGGTLNVTLLSGFTPPHNSTYQIVTFASHGSTTFANTFFDPSFMPPIYNNGDVTMNAI